MTDTRKPYPSDVSDEQWAPVVPYLTLLPEDSGCFETLAEDLSVLLRLADGRKAPAAQLTRSS